MAQGAENGTAESVPAHQFVRIQARYVGPKRSHFQKRSAEVKGIAEFSESSAAGNFET
jgi:hypothetical protein